MNKPLNRPARVQHGAVHKYLYAVIVAVAVGGYTAYRLFRQGSAGIDSYTIFMSLAAIAAAIIVAPKIFTPDGGKQTWEGARSFSKPDEPSQAKDESTP